MTRLGCPAVRDLLGAYHDGELDLHWQAAVQAHLRTCAACATERLKLRQIGLVVREAAATRVPEDPGQLGRQVLTRWHVERQQAWPRQLEQWFEDLHLVWAAIGATAATLICVAAVLGLVRAGGTRPPAAMSSLIGMMAHPGSNLNPVRLDGRHMLLPRSDPESPMTLSLNRDDAIIALLTVVTREGRVSGVELLPQDAERIPINENAMTALLDAAAQARFEPARAGGAPVAVNMVWLLAQTRVVGKATTLSPAPSRSPAAVAPVPISERDLPGVTGTRLV